MQPLTITPPKISPEAGAFKVSIYIYRSIWLFPLQAAAKRKMLEALLLEEKKLGQLLELKALNKQIEEMERIKKVQQMPLMQAMPRSVVVPQAPAISAPAFLCA